MKTASGFHRLGKFNRHALRTSTYFWQNGILDVGILLARAKRKRFTNTRPHCSRTLPLLCLSSPLPPLFFIVAAAARRGMPPKPKSRAMGVNRRWSEQKKKSNTYKDNMDILESRLQKDFGKQELARVRQKLKECPDNTAGDA
mgnify:CR=1 FL=1